MDVSNPKRRKISRIAHPVNHDFPLQKLDQFELQITELLYQLQPNFAKCMVKAESTLRKLKLTIESLPSRDPLPIVAAEDGLRRESGISIPWGDYPPPLESKYTLTYRSPTNINVVGSCALRSAVCGAEPLCVDLAVTMPPDIFTDKDYLDYRYFYKRSYYIACIAAGLTADEEREWSCTFSYQNDSVLQPCLIVAPKETCDSEFAQSKCHIRILLAAPRDIFRQDKLLPWKCSVRTKSLGNQVDNSPRNPTAFYNATIQSECSSESFLAFTHDTHTKAEHLREACILTKLWLRQRGFHEGGFGGFESTAIFAWLLRSGGRDNQPLFSSTYNSYQLFRAFLQFLESTNLIKDPLILSYNKSADTRLFKSNVPVIYDDIRGLNLLFKMTPWSYHKLRREAQLAMKCLSRPTFDRLYPLFIAKVDDYLLQYDCIFRFSIQKLLEANSTIRSERPYVDVCTNVYTTLTSALGNRIVSTSYLPEHYPSWDPHAKDHPQLEPTAVTVGLVVNEENVNRLFDHGPAAEDESAAASFRQFWGEKAELRRFKDGRILESLVWTSHRAGNVLEQIIQYVIMRHCGREAAASIDFLGGNLDAILLRKEGVSNPSHVFDLAWNQYSQLEKRIRDLEGLPLTIRQVSPSSPALRRTSRFSPNVDGIPQPIDITVQFEASTRWPGDLVAVQRMKAALCLKLGTLLEQIGPYRTRVSLENDHHPWLNQVALDISMEGKTTFRLRIHHEHDIVLLEDKLKSQSEWARESIASALASYKRMFLFQPVHTQVVQGLCTRYPLLSSSIRLLKQWLVSHLLAPFFCDELVELITIRAFTYAHPYSNPGSLRTAFLRILLTIAKWDWQTEPLVVELNGELDAQEHRRMQMHFEGWRSIDPAMNRMVMFVSSNLDPEGTIWTDKVPKVVAARLVALAQAACSVVKRQGLESKIESLFIPSLAEYDFTLIMNPKYLRKQSSYTSAGRETGLGSDASDSNLIDCFLVELQSLHSETIIFFHGGGDSDFIGGLWNPHSATRPWKPSLTHSTAPVLPDSGERGSEGEVTINKMGILNDILRLGGDLVQEVKVKKSS